MDKAWASAILSEGQELATPQSGKSATPLRGEVKPADCGVASLADTSGIGCAMLLAFGRFDLTQILSMAMREAFAYREQPNFPPRYNIAPTQPVPVVRLDEGRRQFILMRWGFIPGWVKDPKDYPLVINVRSESASEKPSFRAALTRRRCLMPADGFYEWHRLGEGRQQENRPYLFRRPDRGLFAFA
eukprot:gene29431-37965_t